MADSPILPVSNPTANEDTALVVRDRATALAANPQLAAQTSALEVLKQKAVILLESGLLPDSVKKWQQAAAIMMRAEELDVDYWTGLIHLNAIKGAPQPDGQLCMAMILRSNWMEDYAILETTDQTCSIRMKRYGQPAFTVTCTLLEYEKVAGPDARRQPKTHLFWYTYKQGARRLFSDVLNNMHPRRAQQRQLIVETDLLDDLPEDAVFIVEEGEDKPTATAPLSVTPNAPPQSPVVIDSDNDSGVSEGEEVDAAPLGSLDMKSLEIRAIRAGLADNEFHFANILKQMLADGRIREGSTADKVLDVMRAHKAAKEFTEGTAGSVEE